MKDLDLHTEMRDNIKDRWTLSSFQFLLTHVC